MITIKGVSHDIGRTPILRDISVDIPKGKITALIGPNGAGKSTLLSLIARLTPHATGQIFVDELEVGKTATRTLAKRLAILPQTPEFTPRLSVADLIAFGRYPHHQGRPGPSDHQKVARAQQQFELDAFTDRPLDTLSGGQRQRALLAMIFAQDTDYVLLDEPLNNLDIAASRALMKLLRNLCQNHGRTVVIVLHDINYAAAYADQIITLKDGELGPAGTPDAVVSDAMIEQVFETDAQVVTASGRQIVLV